ncbi:class I SAM-dependent DNA methyltransferase [Roseococcus sp. DSY-14]|uniref:class I SAM-dependent DNA methyltransferase n=1 Tax=Roseococcus sp. DSY-14 TaxID=3369650 RepID=UPI00387B90A0
MNAVEIEQAVTALAEQPFDRAAFPYAFLEAFGNKPTTLKKLRSGASNRSDLGGVLQTNNIHIATCDPGAVPDTLRALKASPATSRARAKFILATDGDTLEAEELAGGETLACALPELADHFGFFLPLAGITTVKEIRESAFDIRATSRLNRLYVELLRDNPDWGTAARRPELNHFFARLIFCFFAEDTDIFRKPLLFTSTVQTMSAADAGNTHEVISAIFRAMNVKLADRAAERTPRWADAFPYVNGGLFSGSAEVPRFSRIARSYLLHIGNLDWRRINPDIFGSMIQAVAEDEERGALGMHYTSVPNILKVLNPLFLDDLREKLAEAGDNARKLLNLRNRIARIRVFDPACGSGNFLVIAYKEMRAIEAEINRRRRETGRRSEIPLTNFRGIELRDFPAEIARLALIIAEYQADVLHRGQQEALDEFLPLDTENWITCGNALRLDWLSICPPVGTGVKLVSDDLFETPLEQAQIDFENEGGEIFVCGNPPYSGKGKKDDNQISEMKRLFGHLTRKYGYIDYVGCWFLLAADYCRRTGATSALVATNSICQGRQLPQLWPLVLRHDVEIFHAHHSFKWANNAARNAGVTCVIVGLAMKNVRTRKTINDGEFSRTAANINAYLIDGADLFVTSVPRPLAPLPAMVTGSVPNDGGHLILSPLEVRSLTAEHADVRMFIRPFFGSQDYLQGATRSCLMIGDRHLEMARSIPEIERRLESVASLRAESDKEETRELLADIPHRFQHHGPVPRQHAIIIPSVSSERREWFPAGLVPAGTVVSNLAFLVSDSAIWPLGILLSRLHLTWIATVCGKLETRYRYSNTLGWNTFPVPILTETNKADLTRCAEDILLAREAHFPATIADLYDPEAMPADLRAAHDRNDEVLERIYIGRRFRNDTERLEKLFDLYTKMTSGPEAAAPKAPRKPARAATPRASSA